MLDLVYLELGTIFTNAELMEKFGVSNSGGMRRSLKNNLLILTHKKTVFIKTVGKMTSCFIRAWA